MKNILRMETKITEREDSHEFLYPIVLPGDHPLIIRLIEEEHRRSCHAGSQILFGVLREVLDIGSLKGHKKSY